MFHSTFSELCALRTPVDRIASAIYEESVVLFQESPRNISIWIHVAFSRYITV